MILNKHSFQNFIIDDGNELAHAVATRTVDGSMEYNPFIIFGKLGSGKTHLLQATKRAIQRKNKRAKILYTTGKKFASKIVNLIRTGHATYFDDFMKYCNCYDAIIIDDIDHLNGKPKTQEIFHRVIEDLVSNNKRVIISSGLPPKKYLPIMYSYNSGIIVDMQIPKILKV